MNWLGWILTGVAVLWGLCFALALPVFVVLDTRNNWAHGNTGLFGYLHTLARIPLLALATPLYLVLVARHALSHWRA